jgi:hypothetical protein
MLNLDVQASFCGTGISKQAHGDNVVKSRRLVFANNPKYIHFNVYACLYIGCGTTDLKLYQERLLVGQNCIVRAAFSNVQGGGGQYIVINSRGGANDHKRNTDEYGGY